MSFYISALVSAFDPYQALGLKPSGLIWKSRADTRVDMENAM
jgi:hypothetical protein